jgi:FMN phosphatase YigB (HAD superfamily)
MARSETGGEWLMAQTQDIVFLFDVDNTLIDNDGIQNALREELARLMGPAVSERYWAILEELRATLSYVDYIGSLQRLRLEYMHDPELQTMSGWLLDYPFPERVFPGVNDVVDHVAQWGLPVILSDGDAVFQPRKVSKSGLRALFEDRVLIYVHKQTELAYVEERYPARHYVLIDDKLNVLDDVKKILGDRVTTVFPKQGHYAFDPKILDAHPPADITVERIADVMSHDFSHLKTR